MHSPYANRNSTPIPQMVEERLPRKREKGFLNSVRGKTSRPENIGCARQVA
jgi:hypothetical protein